MRFAKWQSLPSSCSKLAATKKQPAVQVITIGRSWWKLLSKNTTFTHDIKCHKSDWISHLGLLMTPAHILHYWHCNKILFCASNAISSHDSLRCLKKESFFNSLVSLSQEDCRRCKSQVWQCHNHVPITYYTCFECTVCYTQLF